MFVYVSGRRCLDFAGTVKHRDSTREELLTRPECLSDWAVQAGLVDRPIDVTDNDLAVAIALREASYRTVICPARWARAETRRRHADQRVGGSAPRDAAAAPKRCDQPRGQRLAAAREPGRGSARPAGRRRVRERQTLCPPGMHAALPGLVASQEPALVRNEHVRQPRQGPSLSGPPARGLPGVGRADAKAFNSGTFWGILRLLGT